jgi:hypothetical protein
LCLLNVIAEYRRWHLEVQTQQKPVSPTGS